MNLTACGARRPRFLMLGLILAGLAGLPLGAVNLQELIPVKSPAYGLLDSILLEAGKLPNTTARPYSIAQFRQMLGWIDPQSLSEPGKAAYQRLLDGLGGEALYDKDGFRFNAGATADLAWYDQTSGVNELRVADYGNREPLLTIPLSFGLGDNLFMGASLDLREEYLTTGRDKFNIPGNLGWFDLQFPFFAYGTFGDEHLSLTVGRTQQAVGPGRFSQLLISDGPDFLEYISFRAAWDPFVYTAEFIDMDPALLPGQTQAATDQEARSFYSHRFELSLFENRINFGVNEGIMVGGVQPELKYFNPLMIFHNFLDWRHASSILSIELTANPWKYIQVYGQYIFNRVPQDYEQKVYGEFDNPFGRAYLIGAESQLPLGPGYLGIVAEFYYADPYMYLRETPYTSYAWHRRTLSNVAGNGVAYVVSKPLGYDFGSDAYNIFGRVEYRVADQVQGGIDVNWAAVGANTIDGAFKTGNDAVQKVTPTGNPEYRLQVGIDASWRIFDWLKVFGSLDWFCRQNANHIMGNTLYDLQPSLGVEVGIGQKPNGLQK